MIDHSPPINRRSDHMTTNTRAGQPHRPTAFVSPLLRRIASAVLGTGLVACGGGSTEESGPAQTASVVREQPLTTEQQETAGQTDSLWLDGAHLNTQELAEAEASAASATGDKAAGKATPAQPKTITRTAVHRFFNTQTNAHFYTTSEAERAHVHATLRQFHYEGAAFEVSRTNSTGLSPVYRFFNSATGVHFYSISDDEKAHIEANLPQLRYEGVAYYASRTQQAGMRPLFRFFLSNRGFHFYSASESERDHIRATQPMYRYEGVAYHVLAAADTIPAAARCGLAGFQVELLNRINQARQSGRVCGSQSMPAVRALTWNSQLLQAATGHAADMASNNYFDHTSLDGRTFSQRITAAGYPWHAVGENIAAGQNSVATVMNSWLASEGHCRNIMNASYTEVAVACSASSSSTYRTYWVMDLGASR
jgi:uncharacterized protein YkwD